MTRTSPPPQRLFSPRNNAPRRAALLGAAACALVACQETAVQLVLNLDRRVPDDMDALCLLIAGRSNSLFSERYALGPAQVGHPQTLTVLPGEQNSVRFEVIVQAERRRIPVWQRREVVDFTDGELIEHQVSVGGCQNSAQGSGKFATPRRLTQAPGSSVAAVPMPAFPAEVVVSWGGQAQRFIWDPYEPDPAAKVKRLDSGIPEIDGDAAATLIPIDIDEAGDVAQVCNTDLVLLRSPQPDLWVHYGDGTFRGYGNLAAVPEGTRTALPLDLNNDGRTDLAFPTRDGVLLRFNEGNGQFGGQAVAGAGAALTDAAAIGAGLLDSDQNIDLVVTRNTDKPAALLINDSVGRFAQASSTVFAPRAKAATAVAVGRFDDDNLDDIAIAHSDGIAIYTRQDATGPYSERPGMVSTAVAQNDVQQLIAADVNNDCRTDLVLVRMDQTSLLVNESGTGFVPAGEFLGGTNATVVDFDGDGLLDVIVGGHPDGAFFLQQCSTDRQDC